MRIYTCDINYSLRDKFTAARRAGKEASILNGLVRPSCLIIDEVGHCEFDKENTRLFFDLIDRRYNKEGNFNIVFTSNKHPSHWRTTLHEYFGHQEVVYVPDGISVIGRNAFTNTKVKKVFLPKSVFLIEEYGFSGTDLIEITGEGVYTIEQRAFYGCKNLERATFPELASCYDISFEGCKRLSRKDLIIPYEAHIIEVEFQPCGCGHRHIKVTPFTNSQNNDDEQCSVCGGNGSGR